VAAIALLSAFASGCGSVAAPAQSRSTSPAGIRPLSAVPPTSAGNRSLARREAQRLLARAVVPPGAKPLSAPPAFPAGPVSLPGATSVVDLSRTWRLPMMTLAQASAWLTAHSPRGLGRPDGPSGISADGTPEDLGYSYSGPVSPAWDSAELQAQVARLPSGGSTVLRVDAQVVWLDPVPIRDTQPGPPARVTIASGCPASDRGDDGVRNTGADLRKALVPAAAPSSGLTCLYDGLNGHPFRLRQHEVLSAAAAARVAAALRSISLSHEIGDTFNCPLDDGSVEIVVLSYSSRADVDLWENLTGCPYTANGFIETPFFGRSAS
jgi:hypothetical protein